MHVPEIRPSVAGLGNQAVVVYSNFITAAPYAAYRLTTEPIAGGTGETQPPVISNVTASDTHYNRTTITWSTDEGATSQVEYGTTPDYGSVTPLDPELVTNHMVEVSGLTPATTYHYRVRSTDGAGNESLSSDFIVTTPAPDTVVVTQATWKRTPYGVLTVHATSTDPTATLTVYSAAGGYYGDMLHLGDGTFYNQYSSPSNPQTIEVRSNRGGSATAVVQAP